jgi:hypothetical protein
MGIKHVGLVSRARRVVDTVARDMYFFLSGHPDRTSAAVRLSVQGAAVHLTLSPSFDDEDRKQEARMFICGSAVDQASIVTMRLQDRTQEHECPHDRSLRKREGLEHLGF